MPMQVEDIEAFIQLLRQDADLRRRVLLAILPEEFYALPARVDKVAQDVTELRQDMAVLRQDVAEIRQDVAELRQEVAEIRQDVAELRAGQEELRQDVTELRAGQAEIRQEVAELRTGQQELRQAQARSDARIARLENVTGKLLGWQLESRYASRPHTYFGRVMKRVQTVDINTILEQASALLSEEELEDLLNLDILIKGRSDSPPVADLFVAIEVSNVIEIGDVTRASYRAELLRRAGFKCVPAVGGSEIGRRAQREAQRLRVAVLLDGSIQGWEQALTLVTE
ncbi:MAG: hypothetical protein HPY54_11120 [Chthonomonadetes bacterium]|nr:hypothetical protein [Chthonomonadetes bacterium]